jgi:mxaA protein
VIPVRTVESAAAACGAWLLAALATSGLLPAAAHAQASSAASPSIAVSVRQPRAFGYVIGDKLAQRISVQAPAGFALDPKSLPRPGRQGLWLELAAPRLTSDRVGGATRYRLTLDYQVINVPDHVRTIDLPQLDLVFSGSGRQLGATVDAWPITISAITPIYILARAGLPQSQPDAPPMTPDSGRYRALTLLWAAAIVALVGGIAVRRRGIPWLHRDTKPFLGAAHDIAKLSRLPPDQATYRRGLQRLHRAFDAAAGHAVFGDRLAPLFAAHPELLVLRTDIEEFYTASQREFFGTHAGDASLDGVLTLARRCREAEAAAARRPAGGATPAPERSANAV